MKIIRSEKEMINHCNELKFRTSFIPTMGSLHEGHIKLLVEGRKYSNYLISSLFINPLQFNNPKDLANYPKNYEEDISIFEKFGVDLLYIPNEKEILNSNIKKINSGWQGKILEGKYRPGHFDGVLTVVNRLFELVNPTSAVFGKKDAQQLYLVKEFFANKSNNLKIIEAEIIRDEYGLAMSSRNRLLSKSGINIARNIFQILKNTKEHFFQNQDIQQAEAFGKELFNENDIEYDYLNFVDPKYFETPDKNQKKLLLITAAYVEGIRLIDNMEVIQ